MYRKSLFITSTSRNVFFFFVVVVVVVVDITLKSSMVHYRYTTFGYFATFSSSKGHPNSYLVAQNYFGYCNFLGQKRSLT